jgi:uracil-DNA glycosylase
MYLLTNVQNKINKMESNIDKFKTQIKTDSEISGWDSILNPFIDSSSFENVFVYLEAAVNHGLRFTPPFKDVFNAFKECSYDDLKVVIVGQDPYPQLGSADGLAFSCSKKGKAEKSLQYINKAIGTDYTDLRIWANQGVLLINTAFTVEVNKIGSHYNLWKPFTNYIFGNINKHKKDTIFILMGKKAEEWETLLPDCKILKCSHPASAAYKGGEWDHNDVFNKVNLELKKQDKPLINW